MKPSYFASHRCIQFTLTKRDDLNPWEFSRRGKKQMVEVEGAVTLDEPTLMLEAVREGLGLAYLTEYNVAADMEIGKLQRVLADWTPPFGDPCLYYPGRRNILAGLRALIDLIRDSRSSR